MLNEKPKGGTEIQFEYLEKYIDKQLLDQVQITTSVPEKNSVTPYKVKYTLAKKFVRST